MMTHALLERPPPRSGRYARVPATAPPTIVPPALPDGPSRSAAPGAWPAERRSREQPRFTRPAHSITPREGDIMQSIRRRYYLALAFLAGVTAPFVTTIAAVADDSNWPF